VGLELDSPIGKNDGSVQGTRYFTVGMLFGLFVRASVCIKGPKVGYASISSVTDTAPGVAIDAISSSSTAVDDTVSVSSGNKVSTATSGTRSAHVNPVTVTRSGSSTRPRPLAPGPPRTEITNSLSTTPPESSLSSVNRRLSSDAPEPEEFNLPLRTVKQTQSQVQRSLAQTIKPRNIDAGLVRLRVSSANKQGSAGLSRTASNNGLVPKPSLSHDTVLSTAVQSTTPNPSMSATTQPDKLGTSANGSRSSTPSSEICDLNGHRTTGTDGQSAVGLMFAGNNPLRQSQAPVNMQPIRRRSVVSSECGPTDVNEESIIMKVSIPVDVCSWNLSNFLFLLRY
jgi:hypothetical protein